MFPCYFLKKGKTKQKNPNIKQNLKTASKVITKIPSSKILQKQFLTIKKNNIPCNSEPSLDRRPPIYIAQTCKQGKPDFTIVLKVNLNFMQLAICIFPHLHFDFT